MGRPIKEDLTDKRFGRLVVIRHFYKHNKWICQCDCGNITHVGGTALKIGFTKSCGCLNSEMAAARTFRHGQYGTPEYRSWMSAKRRCADPTDMNYGGRGITMCPEWVDNFTAFYAYVGPRPTLGHSLDRIDVNKGYEPGNVRWATPEVQANNMRTNRFIEHAGKRQTLSQWARELGICSSVLSNRIRRGHPLEKALTPSWRPNLRPSSRVYA